MKSKLLFSNLTVSHGIRSFYYQTSVHFWYILSLLLNLVVSTTTHHFSVIVQSILYSAVSQKMMQQVAFRLKHDIAFLHLIACNYPIIFILQTCIQSFEVEQSILSTSNSSSCPDHRNLPVDYDSP